MRFKRGCAARYSCLTARFRWAKLSQAIAHGADIIQIDGNFDNCLEIARKLSENYPVFLVNSVNPYRIEGQKTGSFEVVDTLGDAPDYHLLPVGNAGNITAYWKGYKEYSEPYTNRDGKVLEPVATKRPVMWGFQAAGARRLLQVTRLTLPKRLRPQFASVTLPRGRKLRRHAMNPVV